MATTWNLDLEDRLARLEKRQERLTDRIHHLMGQEADAARTPPAAGVSARALPPLRGGQGTAGGLGVWTPGGGAKGVGLREGRLRLLQKVNEMAHHTRTLKDAVTKAETLVGLVGQLLSTVDSPPVAGDRATAPGASVRPTPFAAAAAGSALVPAAAQLQSLLPLLGSPQAGSAVAVPAGSIPVGVTAHTAPAPAAFGPGPMPGAAGVAGPPDSTTAGSDQANRDWVALQALLPLLQQSGANRGGLLGKLAEVAGSPAFQQLLSTLQR